MKEEQIQKWSEELLVILKQTIEKESVYVEEHVNHLKKLNPNISNEDLAKKIISRKSLKAGEIGALCGVGGLLTLPITMPADLYYCFKIHALTILSIAYIYGWNIHDEDAITDVLLVLGASTEVDAARYTGIKVGQDLAKDAILNKFVTKEMMREISRKIIIKAGKRSFMRFAKLIPIVGAPVGAGLNYSETKAIGKKSFDVLWQINMIHSQPRLIERELLSPVPEIQEVRPQ